jgi:hypothetical protein
LSDDACLIFPVDRGATGQDAGRHGRPPRGRHGPLHPVRRAAQARLARGPGGVGVAGFWSHVFPFETAAAGFERALDAWVLGEARIVHIALGGRALRILGHGRWTTIHQANGLLPVPRRPRRVFTNATAAPEAPRPGEDRP